MHVVVRPDLAGDPRGDPVGDPRGHHHSRLADIRPPHSHCRRSYPLLRTAGVVVRAGEGVKGIPIPKREAIRSAPAKADGEPILIKRDRVRPPWSSFLAACLGACRRLQNLPRLL